MDERLREWSAALARSVTSAVGSAVVAVCVFGIAGAWLIAGFLTGFPGPWQAALWSAAALISVVMLFVLQHTTNRESQAALLKLDELIRVAAEARNDVIDVENRPLREQERLAEEMTQANGALAHVYDTEPTGRARNAAPRQAHRGQSPRPAHDGEHDTVPVIGSLADLVALVDSEDNLYLRYSEGPEADKNTSSTDFESGLQLPGLAVSVLDPQPWWSRPLVDWVARQVCKYRDLAEEAPHRHAWVLTGREAARGPDHEPLLTDIQPVAVLADQVVSESVRHYNEHFDVGRTS
jgi:low affinity Fe/Cu permease